MDEKSAMLSDEAEQISHISTTELSPAPSLDKAEESTATAVSTTSLLTRYVSTYGNLYLCSKPNLLYYQLILQINWFFT